jgi:hypothetical protein
MTSSFFANFIDDQSSINRHKPKKLNRMKTKQQSDAATAVFLQTVSAAVTQLKQKLQQDYEQAYPGLGEIIRLVLDEEETKAWELSLFPHLLLPDLVEAHVARLDLQPAETKHDDVLVPHRFLETPTYRPALALCG